MSYSICCSAEQSGAAGGGQASLHKGGGETEGKRRGRQSAQHLSSTRKRSTAGRAQEKTLTHIHTDKWTGQSVEVKQEPVGSSEAQAGPGRKVKVSTRGKTGRLLVVLFLRSVLLPLHQHGGMDHSGEAAGGGCPAALYHDWKVRH